jgi:hypothetical protein
MRCTECGGEIREVVMPVIMDMPFVGQVVSRPVLHEKCQKCGETMLPREASKALDEAYYAKERQLVEAFPVGDFVPAEGAAEMLGKSRQALHKDSKIRRGFVYRVMIGNSWLYLRRSVEKYREDGDGRFDLTGQTCSAWRTDGASQLRQQASTAGVRVLASRMLDLSTHSPHRVAYILRETSEARTTALRSITGREQSATARTDSQFSGASETEKDLVT